jgi:hypothetical protein
MGAKSPVVGRRVPIFKPLALLAAVVEFAAGVAVVSVLPVLLGLVVSLQAPNNKPVATVATLKAKAAVILCIKTFTPLMFRSLKVRFKLHFYVSLILTGSKG